MKPYSLLQLIFIIAFPVIGFAQIGSLDKDFGGGDGLVTTSYFDDQPSQAYGIAVQEDGKIIVTGITRITGLVERPTLTRYLPDGTLDETFNGTGKIVIPIEEANGYCREVVVQPDGKIVTSGTHYTGSESKLVVYRFNPDGTSDNNFDGDGIATRSFNSRWLGAGALTLQPDGKILVGGYVGYDQDTFDRFMVVRFLSNGIIDSTYSSDGIDTMRIGRAWNNVYSMVVQPDGKIVAGGYSIFEGEDDEDLVVVRRNSDGTPDNDFGVNGIARASFGTGYDAATGVGIQADGKIVAGGYALSPVTGKSAFAAARFHSNGVLDDTYAGDGMTTIIASGQSDAARTAKLQPDGKLILGGYSHSNINGGADRTVIRLDQNGLPDYSFHEDGIAIYEDGDNTSSEIHELAIQPDGKIVGAGFNRIDGLNSIGVVRIISGLTVSTSDVGAPHIDISIFPNPVQEEINISYELKNNERISIQLLDINGRFIENLLPSQNRNAGNHLETLEIRQDLAPGSYFINVVAQSWNSLGKIVVRT